MTVILRMLRYAGFWNENDIIVIVIVHKTNGFPKLFKLDNKVRSIQRSD